MTKRRGKKKPYPHNTDIIEAMMEVLNKEPIVNPLDFPDKVRGKLSEKGFYTGLVTDKRIWRLYEEYVKKGFILDYLGVVTSEFNEYAEE